MWWLWVRCWLRLFVLSLWCFGAASLARADDVEQARVLFNAGIGASAAERYDEARLYFQRSAALMPKAATFLNLAVAEIRLGQGRAALASLEAFDRVANPAEHRELMERAVRLRGLAEGLAAAEPAPDVAELAQPAPAPEPAPPLRPGPPPIVAPPHATPLPPAAAPHTWLAPASMFAGAVVAAGGTYAFARGWSERSQKLDECTTRVPPCQNRDDVLRQRNAVISGTIIAGAGALALLTTGIVWLVRRGSKQPSRGTVTPMLTGFGARF